MKLSEHFDLSEFACKDGTPYPEEWIETRLKPLVKDLETIRMELGLPLRVNSAYRTFYYNRKVAGALFSEHTKGNAVDISSSISAYLLHKIILKLIKEGKIKDGGVGSYPTWVHYDHGKPRRW